MRIQKYNISKPEKYQSKNQGEKTIWHNVGILTEFYRDDGNVSRIIEIPAIGLKANVFPFQDKSGAQQPKPAPQSRAEAGETIEYPSEPVNPDDIPF